MKKIILLSLILFSSITLLSDSDGWSSDEEETQLPLSTQYRYTALGLFSKAREATMPESKYLFLITAKVAVKNGLKNTTVHQNKAKIALDGVQRRIELAERRLRLSEANKKTIRDTFLRAARTTQVNDLAAQLERQSL